MKRLTISIVLFIALAAFIFVFIQGCASQDSDETDFDNSQIPLTMPDESILYQRHESAAFTLVENMKAGWNLGNTLDSFDNQKRGINFPMKTMTAEVYYETSWGNPVTTPKMISDIAGMGFGAVRVPVTWYDHMDDDYTITPAWLERVREVVDYVVDSGMYCIINLHHDTGSVSRAWLLADPDNLDEYKRRLHIVWNQIAEFFQDYDEKLLFESFNEIRDMNGKWSDSTPECYDAVNQLNQVFVDTVRSTGGTNANRFLIVSPYAASVDNTVLSYYRMPADTAENRLIASVHSYAPAVFSWTENEITWTKTYSEWDEAKFSGELENMFESIRTNLVDNGIPVIISECGAWNKNNSGDRIAYAEYLVREAAKYQISCFWWDTGGSSETPETTTTSTLYDRNNEKWLFPEVAEAFVKAAGEAWSVD